MDITSLLSKAAAPIPRSLRTSMGCDYCIKGLLWGVVDGVPIVTGQCSRCNGSGEVCSQCGLPEGRCCGHEDSRFESIFS